MASYSVERPVRTVRVIWQPRIVIDTASGEEIEAIETSLIGGSANRNFNSTTHRNRSLC
jgi:hypothetical protein